MVVALLGSGNVATVLGRLIKSKGHEVVQVLSRSTAHAKTLANRLEANWGDFTTLIDERVQLIIVATSDASLKNSFIHLNADNRLVVHTAGAVSASVLKVASLHYGVLYPLQTLRKELDHIPTIPFLVDANSEDQKHALMAFALTLSDQVYFANDEQRLAMHTAAVIVSNFSNHLYAAAEKFCKAEGLEFDLLKPLISETANKVFYDSPESLQTGPAVRKDIETMAKHLQLLVKHPKLRTLYMRMTDSIMNP